MATNRHPIRHPHRGRLTHAEEMTLLYGPEPRWSAFQSEVEYRDLDPEPRAPTGRLPARTATDGMVDVQRRSRFLVTSVVPLPSQQAATIGPASLFMSSGPCALRSAVMSSGEVRR
jgi:hypothetical protein